VPDFDGDGDVDQSDFGVFQSCMTGPFVLQMKPECALADLDGDGDVDEEDFSRFFACFSGAGTPADPLCNP
jgi:hypothetical protein